MQFKMVLDGEKHVTLQDVSTTYQQMFCNHELKLMKLIRTIGAKETLRDMLM